MRGGEGLAFSALLSTPSEFCGWKKQFNYWNSSIPALEVKLYEQKEKYINFFFQRYLIQDSAVQETCKDLDFKA